MPDQGCDTSKTMAGAAPPFGAPASAADFEAPASTVLATDTKPLVIRSSGAFYSSHFVSSPAAVGPNSTVCAYSGWGVDSSWELPDTGVKNTSTGNFNPRHSGGGNVIFCDGHTKWMTPGGLAVGTNWKVGITEASVQITNLSSYLWSLKKTGTSDL